MISPIRFRPSTRSAFPQLHHRSTDSAVNTSSTFSIWSGLPMAIKKGSWSSVGTGRLA